MPLTVDISVFIKCPERLGDGPEAGGRDGDGDRVLMVRPDTQAQRSERLPLACL